MHYCLPTVTISTQSKDCVQHAPSPSVPIAGGPVHWILSPSVSIAGRCVCRLIPDLFPDLFSPGLCSSLSVFNVSFNLTYCFKQYVLNLGVYIVI